MLVFMWNAESVQATPYVPDSDSAILESIPLSADARTRQLRTLRSDLSRDPQNIDLAVRLARQFIELGRAEADPRYDGYAQAALQPWWNSSNPPTPVLLLRALLRQRSHQFDEALVDLTHILRIQPNHAQAWLTRAVIHQVRGHYEEAQDNCLPLLRLTDALISTTCIANVTSLNGQAKNSYQGLLNIFSQTSTTDPQLKLWALAVLAEMAARLGDTVAAEAHFQQAMSLGLRDLNLVAAYSDWLLDQNRPADALALLGDDLRSDGLLLRAALAAQQLNSPQLPQYIANLSARFADNRLRGDARHLREEARFTLHLLHQPHQALQLAEDNWKIQREPWDARILLEAAHAAGNHKAAQPVIAWLKTVKLEDRLIHQLIAQFA
ncbi:MAG: hypothetical protein H0X47_12490 [Nitrospirales bacterium]|nr:hypothetical protein [Nitrospirales bacterium]